MTFNGVHAAAAMILTQVPRDVANALNSRLLAVDGSLATACPRAGNPDPRRWEPYAPISRPEVGLIHLPVVESRQPA